MTPEEIKAQKEQEAADKKAAEDQAKADEKAAKEAAKEAEKAEKEAQKVAYSTVKHAKHEHKPGKYSLKDLVSFECKYPEGYKGKKHLKEGKHKIHRMTAERLQTKRIGKIVG